jgi:hypothetical protein
MKTSSVGERRKRCSGPEIHQMEMRNVKCEIRRAVHSTRRNMNNPILTLPRCPAEPQKAASNLRLQSIAIAPTTTSEQKGSRPKPKRREIHHTLRMYTPFLILAFALIFPQVQSQVEDSSKVQISVSSQQQHFFPIVRYNLNNTIDIPFL